MAHLSGTVVGLGVAPRLLSAAALSRRRIRAVFDEPLAAAGTWTLTANGTSIPRNVGGGVLAAPTVVEITTDGDLSDGVAAYTVMVENAADLAGNLIDPEYDTTDVDVVLSDDGVDHVALALSRLIAQYRGQPNIEAVLRIAGGRYNGIEQQIANIGEFRALDTAYGAGLDRLGGLLGLARNGRADASYRTLLRAKARAIGSRGTRDDFLAVLEVLAGATAARTTYDAPPAGAIVETHPISLADGAVWASILRPMAPAGVRLVVQHDEGGVLFGWDEDARAGGWAEGAAGGAIWAEAR